jgi:hypothetical protein
MNIQELGEAVRKLKAKAVLEGDGAHDSLNTAWNDLEVIYVHARQLLGGASRLSERKKIGGRSRSTPTS